MVVVDQKEQYLKMIGDSDEISADLELAVRGMLNITYELYGKEATDYIAVLLSKMMTFAFQKFEAENGVRLDLGDPQEAAADLAQAVQLAWEEQSVAEDAEDIDED